MRILAVQPALRRPIWASIAVLFVALLMAAVPAQAEERRVALVIGNAKYEHTPALRNPPNDAGDMAAALEQMGFDVMLLLDLDEPQFRAALREFSRAARQADVAVFFFAGHGVSVGGQSWLLPVSSRLAGEADVAFETIPLALALEAVQGASKLRLVILDACRDNPFVASMAPREGATRSVTRGLSRVEPRGDTVVWYAAKDGSTADDGAGRNSPFTEALLRHMQTPGLELDPLFREVVADVRAATNRRQEPFQYGTRGRGDFFFTPAAVAVGDATGECAPSDAERSAYKVALEAGTLSAIDVFLEKFPESCRRPQAEAYRAVLAATLTPQPDAAPDVAPTVDAMAERWAALSGSGDPAELEAFITVDPTGPFASAARAELADLYRAGQRELSRLGLYRAGVDGDWGAGSQRAMRSFQRREAMAPADGRLTKRGLAALRAAPTPARPPSASGELTLAEVRPGMRLRVRADAKSRHAALTDASDIWVAQMDAFPGGVFEVARVSQDFGVALYSRDRASSWFFDIRLLERADAAASLSARSEALTLADVSVGMRLRVKPNAKALHARLPDPSDIWVTEMDAYQGGVFIVTEVTEWGVSLKRPGDANVWNFDVRLLERP